MNWQCDHLKCFAGLLGGCQTKHSKRRRRENPTLGFFPIPLLFVVFQSSMFFLNVYCLFADNHHFVVRPTFPSNILPLWRSLEPLIICLHLTFSIIHPLCADHHKVDVAAVELSRDHRCGADRPAGGCSLPADDHCCCICLSPSLTVVKWHCENSKDRWWMEHAKRSCRRRWMRCENAQVRLQEIWRDRREELSVGLGRVEQVKKIQDTQINNQPIAQTVSSAHWAPKWHKVSARIQRPQARVHSE